MSIKKIGITVVAVALLASATWLGASIYVGRTTEKWISTLVEQTTKQKKLRLVNLKHEQSLFHSQGQFEIRFNDLAADAATGKQKLSVIVDYKISNLLFPESSMRFNWSLKPSGEYGVEVNRLFGSELALTGNGKLGYGGRALTSLKMPELVMRDGADRLQISPSSGQFSWAGQALAFDWSTARITMLTDGMPLDIDGVTAKADFTNSARGIGSFEFKVDKFSTKEGTAEGVGFQTSVAERQDRLDLQLNHKLTSLTVAGQKIRDVAVDLTLSGLDVSSIDTLSAIASDSDDFQNLTADEQSRSKVAIRKLLNQSFTIALPKITAQVNSGSISGDAKVEFLKSDNIAATEFSTAKSMRASGQLLAKGKAVDNAQKMMAIMMGLATDSKDGLKANFEFTGNTFKANGKTRDVSSELSFIDSYINGLIAP
jgi:uncharacterized protein YdgA (DUF945 family)